MNNSNVWGSGGLFEQALASKLGLQQTEGIKNIASADTMYQNANTSESDVGNRYDLGLRGARIDQMNADTNRLNADVNKMNANTSAFGADTERLVGFNRLGKAAPDSALISSLGLRTVNPYEPASKSSATIMASTPAMLPNQPSTSSATQPASTPTTSAIPPIMAARRTGVEDQLGWKRGGLVMKPKMVQPGYMHGGKVSPPKGYKKGGMVGCANGGKIGDVKKDTGRDTIDAKVRPGEYMLNPETVRHIGGGDYAAGVRNLNQIVRQATGKEPGPTPMGKSGKAGFENSGDVPPSRALVPVYDPNRGPGPNGFGPVDEAAVRAERMRYPIPVYDRRYGPGPNGFGPVDPIASQYTYASGMGPNDGPSVRERFTRFNNPDVGASIRAGAQRAGAAVRGAAPQAVQGLDKGLRVAGKVLTPIAAAVDASNVVDVATDPNMAGRDVAGEVAGKAAKWAGATAGAIQGGSTGAAIGTAIAPGPGTALGGTIGALGGGVLGYFGVDKTIRAGRALRGVDTRDPSEYSQGVVSDFLGQQNQPTAAAAVPAKEKEKEKPEAAPRDFDKEVADKLAESEPGLRDMMLARYRELNNGLKDADAMRTIVNLNQMEGLQRDLTELDKAGTVAAASMINARATAGNKLREDADKRIGERFQIPVYDKDGNVKGYEKDPNAANALRDFAAQTYVDESGAPMDFYRLTPQQQDVVMQEYDVNSRGTRRLNERLASEGGSKALISRMPRIGANSLRSDGEMTWHDIFDPNISFDDWLTSFGPNQTEKMVMRDPVTGQRVAARHVLMNENGTIDDDLIAQINRAAAARAEAEAAAKAKKK